MCNAGLIPDTRSQIRRAVREDPRAGSGFSDTGARDLGRRAIEVRVEVRAAELSITPHERPNDHSSGKVRVPTRQWVQVWLSGHTRYVPYVASGVADAVARRSGHAARGARQA